MPPKRKAPRGRPTSVVHEVAGEFNGSGRISCILCGKVIVDYSDAQFEFDGTPTKGGEAERAFPPGPVTLVMGAGPGSRTIVKLGAVFGAKRCLELSPD